MYTTWADFRQNPSGYQDITHLDASADRVDINDARLIASVLSSNNCSITHFKIGNGCIDNVNTGICIMDSIALNRSINHLDFHNNNVHRNSNEFTCQDMDTLITHLAEAIRTHPCIRSLDLSYNRFNESAFSLGWNIPYSLKHLNLGWNPFLSGAGIGFIIKNTQLQSIDLSGLSAFFALSDCKREIMDSTSLLEIKYTWMHHMPTVILESIDRLVYPMLSRNRSARDFARKSAICLLLIRKFRQRQCGLLGCVPKELVTIVAKDIFDSYADHVWHLPKPRRKKVRL